MSFPGDISASHHKDLNPQTRNHRVDLAQFSEDSASEDEGLPGYAEDLEARVRRRSRWGDQHDSPWSLLTTMVGGPTCDEVDLEGGFDGEHNAPPDPPLDAFVTSATISPPRPSRLILECASRGEVIPMVES